MISDLEAAAARAIRSDPRPREVWKYPLDSARRFTILMPRHAEILCLQLQRGAPTLWALVCPESPLAKRLIFRVITGGEVPRQDDGLLPVYIGTWQDAEGYVFHAFDGGWLP